MNEIKQILDFENNGVCMAIDEGFLYLGSKGSIFKYQLNDMSLITQIKITRYKEKNMYSMVFFSIYADYVFVCDFRDLHVLKKGDLSLLSTVQLGENISSDVLGMIHFDFPNAYVSICNGRIDILNIQTGEVSQHKICDASSWSNCVIGDKLYYSTTKGGLLEININTMEILRMVQLTNNMNIYSVVSHNDMLYTTSERSIRVVDIDSFDIVQEGTEPLYTTEANIIGIYNKNLVIAEHRSIALYYADLLYLYKRFSFPTGYRFLRYAVMDENKIYGSDEHGIYCCALGELSFKKLT